MRQTCCTCPVGTANKRRNDQEIDLPVPSQAVQDKIETLFGFQFGGVAIDEDSEASGSVPTEVSANSTDHKCLHSLAVVGVPTPARSMRPSLHTTPTPLVS